MTKEQKFLKEMDKFLKERFQAKNYDSHKRKPITLVVG
jgi:hypothetical protein